MLKIKGLTKIYTNAKNATKAVNNLSFEVHPGEICGFIGHNGAGKTTTLKAIAGILDFEYGEITIEGRNIKKEPIKAKEITAYIPDNPDLYESLTGVKYLNFIADIYKIEKKTRDERIKKYSEVLEIYGDLGSPIGSYSHGMKQKIAVISALIHSPKLILMDEPFVGLDPVAAHNLKQIMHEICDAGGMILFSTHILDVAEKLCNKVVIIKKGERVAYGSVEEIRGNQSLEDIFMEISE